MKSIDLSNIKPPYGQLLSILKKLDAMFVYNSISNLLVVLGSEHKHIQQYAKTIDFITVNTIFYRL